MSSVDTERVVLDEQAGRFELDLGGDMAVLDFVRSGEQIFFTHTYVPPRQRNRGAGAALAQAALEYAAAEQLAVVPMCSFVARYIDDHREYHPLLRR